MNALKSIIRLIFSLISIGISSFFLNQRGKYFKDKMADFSKVRYTFEFIFIIFLILNVVNSVWLLFDILFVPDKKEKMSLYGKEIWI